MITLKDIESLGYKFSEAKDCYYGSSVQSEEVPEAIKKRLSEAFECGKDGKASISVDDSDDWRIIFRKDMEHSSIIHYRWGKLHIHGRGDFELRCFVYDGDDFVTFVNMACGEMTETVPCNGITLDELKSRIDWFIGGFTADAFEFVCKI